MNKIKSAVNFTALFTSGDGGIRTLVPRRANAFRVRPVMTASIRLPVLRYLFYSIIGLLASDIFPLRLVWEKELGYNDPIDS